MGNDNKINFWQRYVLTIEEASQYFRVGENKIRQLVSQNKNAKWILWNGNRALIKRGLFERYIDDLEAV